MRSTSNGAKKPLRIYYLIQSNKRKVNRILLSHKIKDARDYNKCLFYVSNSNYSCNESLSSCWVHSQCILPPATFKKKQKLQLMKEFKKKKKNPNISRIRTNILLDEFKIILKTIKIENMIDYLLLRRDPS